MTREPTAELPLKGLYGVQWRVWLFTFVAPVLIWFLPFPTPLRLLAFFLPPLFLATGFTVVAILKCPACGKRLMAQGLLVVPRKKCPHCREIVAG
ncbi:hypothetical protein [Sandarakinorhabdus sp.]|uniref:hypothetical protein n=1 Tax=Sandarakinorhabdus sp. TaxID=1916663 RepID=UPI00286E32C1|nr:hypothetical protein [Sandarakinorhabdus sp.]